MTNVFRKPERSNTAPAAALLGALLFSATACQDLVVDNMIEPDRERALGNPSDVEAYIGAAFYPSFFRPVHGVDGGLSGLTISSFTYAAADMTATLAGNTSAVWFLDMAEPRRAHTNSATICSTICEWGPRDFWQRIHAAASIPYDGLQILDNGMTIRQGSTDVTPRVRAFAKFMQGWAWGYAALIFDRVHVVPETVDIPTNLEQLTEFSVASLTPYAEAIEAAVASLEEAIDIAREHPGVVSYPGADQTALWFGSAASITNSQFIQMANTLAARLLVLGARTPQERAQVDWQRVLDFTASGVTTGNDFEFLLTASRTSQLIHRLQNNASGALGTTNGRWNYHTIGLADQGGAYQSWIASSHAQRNRFDIVTPDRRITGTTPTSSGSYTCYRADNNGFDPARGTYRFSAYQWARHKMRNDIGCGSAVEAQLWRQTGLNLGTTPMITADENNLLRAEAILRTAGVTQEAVNLINLTRTREHLGESLPALVIAGVPEIDGACVPRTDSGACGTVWTALRYERMIELAGQDALRSYADSRGFGMLPDGSLLSFPVPGNVLEQYGLPIYTYGGTGNGGSATYAPVN